MYDTSDPTARWTLSPVTAQYPQSRTGLVSHDDQAVHRQLLEVLADKITAKFFTHEESEDAHDRLSPRPGRNVAVLCSEALVVRRPA